MAEPIDAVLRSALAGLSSIVFDDRNVSVTLGQVAVVARDTIPGVEAVSVTLVDHGVAHTAAATDDLARQLDERQYELGYGPCLDASLRGRLTIIADTDTGNDTDARWPGYLAMAREQGVGSQIGVPLRLSSTALGDERVLGALNGYATQPGALAHVADVAEVFARYAAACVHRAQRTVAGADVARDLRAALTTNAVVEQARGITMALHGGSPEAAAQRLEQEARRRGISVIEVAEELVDSHGNRDQPPVG